MVNGVTGFFGSISALVKRLGNRNNGSENGVLQYTSVSPSERLCSLAAALNDALPVKKGGGRKGEVLVDYVRVVTGGGEHYALPCLDVMAYGFFSHSAARLKPDYTKGPEGRENGVWEETGHLEIANVCPDLPVPVARLEALAASKGYVVRADR